jgi:hypothetical protein
MIVLLVLLPPLLLLLLLLLVYDNIVQDLSYVAMATHGDMTIGGCSVQRFII